MNAISSILRRCENNQRLNIITFSGHERFEPNLCRVNADFYSLNGPNVKPWNTKFSKIPENYFFVTELKPHINFDCIISHNPFSHIQLGSPLSKQLHIPIINIFHTDSPGSWSQQTKQQNQGFFDQCAHHVFISEYNKISWSFSDDKNTSVITHGIDSELFKPLDIERENVILSVANDYAGRNFELGFDIWRAITQNLPVKVIGNTLGLSKPAESLEELVGEYQKSQIFLNTSLRSPMPMSLIEGAACGNAILTTNTNAICDFFTHGYDALIFSPNDLQQGRAYLEKLLKDKHLCKKLGENARRTILEKFKISDFVDKWEGLLRTVCGKVYK